MIDFSTLDQKKFSELCDQLIKAEYPQSKPIEGSGGDEGIDSFIGNFDEIIKVFQYKFFIKTIGNVQKSQIKKSLSVVKEKHKVNEWILVIPRNFTTREARFFLQIQKDNADIKIDYLGATELKNLLYKYKNIREIYFKEDKILKELESQGKKTDEIFNIFKEEVSIGKLYNTRWTICPVNICKFNIINIPLKNLIAELEKNYKYTNSRKLGFIKFDKISEDKYKTRFILKNGLLKFKVISKLLDDDPFELRYPDYADTEIWILDITDKTKSIPKVNICIFSSTKEIVELVKKIFKDCVSLDSVIIEDIEFNKIMKNLVNRKFCSAIDTLQIEPNLVQKAKQETGQEIDVKIKKDTIYGDQSLPKTKFVIQVMKYVKPIKNKEVSDIIYFRAKQSSKLDKGKQITFELHNDGRVRFWFLKKDYPTLEAIKEKASEIVDNLNSET